MGSLSQFPPRQTPSCSAPTANMNKIIFFTLLAVAAARPDGSPEVAIVRSDVISPSADGAYSFDVETSDGMVRSESGAGTGEDGAVESQGQIHSPQRLPARVFRSPSCPRFPPPNPPIRPRPDRLRCQPEELRGRHIRIILIKNYTTIHRI